ncbi:hypothetical protein [Planctomicrobium piriforme]|uniref:Uncharacterized protein n=1 Tax=Planctomicrobium piriforme TaxID=1576369 RepID=A0A1I3M742_9PLAN|nr:hypothetical protein [Planctomicrobium piriforme]SFI92793.1 hypothetical protein SAMN05421753_113180 [Planctomicrobium piriforme]
MCRDAIQDDIAKSRTRWYDLPAAALYHRPMRCLICDERFYSLRHGRRYGLLPRLWMHYSLIAMVAAGAFALWNRSSPTVPQDIEFAKLANEHSAK